MKPIEILRSYEKQIPGVFGAVVGTREESPAGLHAGESFPAASLIKVPILIYLLRESDRGNLDLQEIIRLKDQDKVDGSGILLELHDGIPLTLLDIAILMIVVSDNTATNILMDRLGTEKIQAYMSEIGLTKTVAARKLMVELDAPPANFTSPSDMYLLYRKLVGGELLSPESTRQALQILSRQQYNEKIPLLLPKNTKVAHKTGEITGVRHDCGILDPENREIILCFLTKNVTDELKTDRVLAELSRAVFDHYMKAA